MRYLLLFTLFISFTACTRSASIYIVRHGERANDSDTTSLSAAGHERAFALAKRLEGLHLDTIFVTPYLRTQQTAAKVASLNALPFTQYPAAPTSAIISRLAKLDERRVLVVGHSNTILEIAKGLGTKPSMTKIEHLDYDNLLFIQIRHTLFGKRVHLYEETYGKPTP